MITVKQFIDVNRQCRARLLGVSRLVGITALVHDAAAAASLFAPRMVGIVMLEVRCTKAVTGYRTPRRGVMLEVRCTKVVKGYRRTKGDPTLDFAVKADA